MTTVPDLNTATASPAAAPRIKLSPQGFCIDHPDPELGERLMADALGVADPDAMHGILRQLVRASVKGKRCDEVNGKAFSDISDARRRIDSFIADVYNKERLHSALGYQSPLEFEAAFAQNKTR